MKICHSCERNITSDRPSCPETCRAAEFYRHSSLCLFCCFAINRHEGLSSLYIVDTDKFLCANCGKKLDIGGRSCPCCPDNVLCNICCNYYKHGCCVQPIRFRAADQVIFAHPAPKNELNPTGIGWRSRDEALQILTRIAPSSWFDPMGFSEHRSHRYVAVEIEIASYTGASALNKALDVWNCAVVHDGSMQTDRGFEINTSPACGKALIDQIRDITTGLGKAEAKLNNRCSIHTHVDCRDFGYQDLQKLIKIYAQVEEALFACVTPSRYNNEYCMPCGLQYYELLKGNTKGDTKSLKTALISSVYGPEAFKLEANGTPRFYRTRRDHYGRVADLGARNPKRYSALNLHSFFLRGTIESRIHHGSIDFDEICQWARFQADFFDSIYRSSESRLRKLSEVSQQEADEVLETIHAKKLDRILNFQQVGVGLVVLRNLLPDHFEALLKKVAAACKEKAPKKKEVVEQANLNQVRGDPWGRNMRFGLE